MLSQEKRNEIMMDSSGQRDPFPSNKMTPWNGKRFFTKSKTREKVEETDKSPGRQGQSVTSPSREHRRCLLKIQMHREASRELQIDAHLEEATAAATNKGVSVGREVPSLRLHLCTTPRREQMAIMLGMELSNVRGPRIRAL